MLCLLIAASASLAIEARSRSRAKKLLKDGDRDHHKGETASGKSTKKSIKSGWRRISRDFGNKSESRRVPVDGSTSGGSGGCRSHRRSGCGCGSSSRVRHHPSPFSHSRPARDDHTSSPDDTLPKYERESKDITITDSQMSQRSNSTSSNNTINSNEINLQKTEENDNPPPYTKF